MRNIRVSAKLFIGFGIVLLMSVIIGTVGIIGMSTINSADNDLYHHNLMSISIMGGIREQLQRTRVGLRNFALYAGDVEELKVQYATMQTVRDSMDELFIRYEGAISDKSLEEAYFTAKNLYLTKYLPMVDEVYQVSMTSSEDAIAIMFSDEVTANTNSMVSAFTTSMLNNEDWAEESVNENSKLYMTLVIAAGSMLFLAVAVSIFLAFHISGMISTPLAILTGFMQKAAATGNIALRQEDVESIAKCAANRDEIGKCIGSTAVFVKHVIAVSDKLSAVAEGDLTIDIDLLSNEDVMGVSVKKMIDSLKHMFSEISNSTAQVAIGSKQIADGAQALAQGSTEQAASVEELSSSISEVSNKTKENAQMASRAANLGSTIRHNAEKGSQQMDQMMQAVKEISDASQSIGKVIKVIDDIAFQTNILALNAAVEAARAGQHGKGFAVVAEEVRNLAAKSAEAAKDTGSLIANSMEKAELGERIAKETADSLAGIVSGINESGQIVSEIAQSSDEQTSAITQINIGIEQVAQVVQQNSATAEQSAAASQEMSGQSDMLQQLVSQFKIK